MVIPSAFAVLIFTGLALTIAVGLLTVSALLGPRRRRKGKLEPYECGVPIMDETRQPFQVHYYLVAVLFLLFDVELAFFLPWTSVYKHLGVVGIIEMGIFALVLILGLVFAWRKKALDWDTGQS